MRRIIPPALILLLAVGVTPASAADEPPRQELTAVNALAPGESGFFSVEGEARGRASGDPADYGAHVDDQRELFWSQHHKPGGFASASGTPETPRPGLRIYRDSFGVPLIYGDTGADVWFGAGYAAGQDRLFLADAVRRLGRGTFGELGGPSYVPDDVRVRVGGYTDAEYQQMFDALPQESQVAIHSYSEGLNAWITKVRSDPRLLPAEYGLLSSLPEPWSDVDTMAAGVYIVRYVASAGLLEPEPLTALRPLVQQYGEQGGIAAFQDLFWTQDTTAFTTVPGVAQLAASPIDAVTAERARYALSLPAALDEGPGTGAYPKPASTPAPPVIAGALSQLRAFVDSLRGGSLGFAIAPKRSATGGALLMSGPQVGYSYPNQLWELEVHGGGYDARGVSIPSLPTVAIGYGERTAWAMTTGYSRTIDSFIETTRPAAAGGVEYLHDGVWKPAECRTETVRYRATFSGAPAGPALQSVDVQVCRTGHGPIVAATSDGTTSRSVQLSIWKRELQTAQSLLAFDRVDTLAEFTAAAEQLTWNENLLYADADGHIAYWHPGLLPIRSPLADPRFPSPGTGEFDWKGLRPRSSLPHVVDPAQGFLANWNTKPAPDWYDTLGDPYSARPSGAAQRGDIIRDRILAAGKLDLPGVERLVTAIGRRDARWPLMRPLLASLPTAGLTGPQQAALQAMLSWDGTTYGEHAGTSEGGYTDDTVTDGPGPTAFRVFADTLRAQVLQQLPDVVVARADTKPVSGDALATTSHIYDATPADNLVLRVLRPETSSLAPHRDWLAGRGVDQVVRAALADAVEALTTEYGDDPQGWRGLHPRRPVKSLSGVIGPSLTMPFEDRGSWEHIVALAAPHGPPTRHDPGRPERPPLATTGGEVVVPLLALLLFALAVAMRRRGARSA